MKIAAGTNRAWHVAGLVAALTLCGVAVIGVARWPDIQFELGYAYENGHFHGWPSGFPQDHRKAARWLGRAAQANHPRAQYMLGILHAHGWGVPRNGALAVEWFTRSARNSYAPACFHLGWMYAKGDGVPRNDDQAIRLLEQAAGQGMAAAHLALGGLHEHGRAVPADAALALKWYALAVHFTRSRPDLFDNAAFAERAQAARDTLVSRVARSSDERTSACPPVAGQPGAEPDEQPRRGYFMALSVVHPRCDCSPLSFTFAVTHPDYPATSATPHTP